MSHTETHFGKLRKVEIPANHSIEDWCRERCQDKGITEISSYNESWLEQLRDHLYEKFFVVGEEVWEIIEHIESEDGDDLDVMILNPDGTITFVNQFYNGGTCLSEVIEDGILRLKKQNKIS